VAAFRAAGPAAAALDDQALLVVRRR